MWALVTGASKGIGAASAKRLAKDGHDVIVHYNKDKAGAEATAKAVRKAKVDVALVQGDLGSGNNVHRMAVEAREVTRGKLSCVVHNAGYYDRRPFDRMGGTAWRDTRAIDLDAPALLTYELLPILMPNASIVFISSVAAMRGSAHGAHYAASKAGLLGLARSLAIELAPKRVNAICPGYVDTEMIGPEPKSKRDAREAEVPLRRVAKPEEIAGVVSFLAGPDSSYITGATIHANGGLWIG